MKMPKAHRVCVRKPKDLKPGDTLIRSGLPRTAQVGNYFYYRRMSNIFENTTPASLHAAFREVMSTERWTATCLTENDFKDAVILDVYDSHFWAKEEDRQKYRNTWEVMVRLIYDDLTIRVICLRPLTEVLILNDNYPTELEALLKWKRETGWYDRKRQRKLERAHRRQTEAGR